MSPLRLFELLAAAAESSRLEVRGSSNGGEATE
jgi:hypothetical protein